MTSWSVDPAVEGGLAPVFASLVMSAPAPIRLEGDLLERLTLAQRDELRVVWVPFEHVTTTARLVVVGITPGRQQAQNALTAFQAALRAGHGHAESLLQADRAGSFSGPMRRNLVDLLNHIGVPQAVDTASSADLFEPDSGLLHTTSALRHAVFVRGENYNGQPDMVRTRELQHMIDTLLADEARMLPKAWWLPLGPKPELALDRLVTSGILEERRVLRGLPHPSGANAERIAYFLGRKPREALSPKTRPDLLDAARARLRRQVAGD